MAVTANPIAPPVPPKAVPNDVTDLVKLPTIVPLLDNAFIKLPVAFVSAIILNNVDIPVAPFPNRVIKLPVAFVTVPNTIAIAPNFAILATILGFNLERNFAISFTPELT